MWSRWAPPLERSILVGLSFAGAQIGIVLIMQFGGVMCEHGFGGGWPSIFYVLGAALTVWLAVWVLFVADFPTTHPRISLRERDYIVRSLADQIDENATDAVH